MTKNQQLVHDALVDKLNKSGLRLDRDWETKVALTVHSESIT